MTAPPATALSRALRAFFSDYLPRLQGLSPHTLHSYRDGLTLLLRFMASQRRLSVAQLDLVHIEAEEVIAFLDHLEQQRHNSIATRNVRLAALHAFFRYVAVNDPEQLSRSQRILCIPFKRAGQRPIEYLEYAEIAAVLTGIDRSTQQGRRDYALLATMFNSGARVQELLDIRACDLQLTKPFQVRLVGKGRKERLCPLWPQTAALLRDLCTEIQLDPRAPVPVFRNQRGQPLTRFGVRYILAKHVDRMRPTVPTLKDKRLHPHSVRHSTAVHLLKSGVDLSTIGQWLGHRSVNTTNRYATVDLDMKRQALADADPPAEAPSAPNWRKDQAILEWLEAL